MKTTLTAEQSAALIKRGVNKDKASAAVIYLDYTDGEVESAKVFKHNGKLLTRLRNGTVIGVESKIVLKDSDSNYSVSIFTLADLLSLLPKTINPGRYYLDLSYGFGDWTASYILWDDCDEGTYIRDTQGEKTADELVDALYQLLCWAIDNHHVKLD